MSDRTFYNGIAIRKLVRPVIQEKDIQGLMNPLHLQTFPKTRSFNQGRIVTSLEQHQSSRYIQEDERQAMREHDKISPKRKKC